MLENRIRDLRLPSERNPIAKVSVFGRKNVIKYVEFLFFRVHEIVLNWPECTHRWIVLLLKHYKVINIIAYLLIEILDFFLYKQKFNIRMIQTDSNKVR